MSSPNEAPSLIKRVRSSSVAETKIALVTGGNKGIGLAICEALVKSNYTVLLACRNVDNGNKAIESIKNSDPEALVYVVEMDVSKEESVKQAASYVKEKWQYLDLLINNAGVAAKGDQFNLELATWTMNTNYYGILNVDKYFTPLLRTNSRVVNVASIAGINALQKMKDEVRNAFQSPNLTVSELTGLVEVFKSCVEHGTWKEMGWPDSMYGVSKAAVIALTRIQARDNSIPGLCVNAVHPGLVKTDMSSHNEKGISPAEGAKRVLAAALTSDASASHAMYAGSSPNGMYWDNGVPVQSC